MNYNKKINRIIFLTVVSFFLISLSLISFAQSQVTINLKTGWNIISAPSKISTDDITKAGCKIETDTKIYRYSDGKFNTFISGYLETGNGYWISVEGDCSLLVNQGECKDITLKKDWNLIGVYKDTSISGVNCIDGDAYYWENGKWVTTNYLKMGIGYWVVAKEDNCKITCAAPQEMTLSFPKFDYSASGGKIENCLLDSNCKKAMAVIDCDGDKMLLWTMGVSSNKIKFGIASCADSSPAELEVGTKASPKEYDCKDTNLKAGTTYENICKKIQTWEDAENIFVKLAKPDSCSKWSVVAV